jgi:ATP-dependent Zn protease
MKAKVKRGKGKEKAVAYHEAGHALVAYRFGHYGYILTIEQKGNVLGSSMSEPDRFNYSKAIEAIIVLYAGFASQSKHDPDANIPRRGEI